MSRPPLPRFAIAIASLCLAAGCAQQGDFPSLAPRPIEKAAATEASPPGADTAAPGADAALLARLRPIVASAQAGHTAFLVELASARPIIERARGAAAGGEAWVAGQQALSRVGATRGALATALADLDQLRRERIDDANGASRTALDETGQQLTTLDAEEASRLAELAAKLD
jgi:hypothetical protein